MPPSETRVEFVATVVFEVEDDAWLAFLLVLNERFDGLLGLFFDVDFADRALDELPPLDPETVREAEPEIRKSVESGSCSAPFAASHRG